MKKKRFLLPLVFILIFTLVGCQDVGRTSVETTVKPTNTPEITSTDIPSETLMPIQTTEPDSTPTPEESP